MYIAMIDTGLAILSATRNAFAESTRPTRSWKTSPTKTRTPAFRIPSSAMVIAAAKASGLSYPTEKPHAQASTTGLCTHVELYTRGMTIKGTILAKIEANMKVPIKEEPKTATKLTRIEVNAHVAIAEMDIMTLAVPAAVAAAKNTGVIA